MQLPFSAGKTMASAASDSDDDVGPALPAGFVPPTFDDEEPDGDAEARPVKKVRCLFCFFVFDFQAGQRGTSNARSLVWLKSCVYACHVFCFSFRRC